MLQPEAAGLLTYSLLQPPDTGGMMIGWILATAALLALVGGCSPTKSPDQMWMDAAAEWSKPGATPDERLQDYQECHQEGVDASTRSGRFRSGSYGSQRSRRLGRLEADDLSRRATRRYSVLERCMAARGWSPTAAESASDAR
jgi:hypothetical protein